MLTIALIIVSGACLYGWLRLAPVKTGFDWKRSPSWANFAAAGADGVGRWYQNEPVTGFMNEFHPDHWIDYLDGRTQKIPGSFLPGIIEARPKTVTLSS